MLLQPFSSAIRHCPSDLLNMYSVSKDIRDVPTKQSDVYWIHVQERSVKNCLHISRVPAITLHFKKETKGLNEGEETRNIHQLSGMVAGSFTLHFTVFL